MLDIVNIKKEIENNTFDRNVFICVSKHKTSDFLFYQYLHIYADTNNLEIKVIDDLLSIHDMFTVENNNIIYVYNCEHLDSIPSFNNKNIWIKCKTYDKNISEDLILELLKLDDWQIKDYISTKYKISIEQSDMLIKSYKDLYKLDIESSKLLNNKFDDIRDQLLYDEESVIFDLVNALVKRDKEALKKVNLSNIEPFGLLALLIKNFKQVINIQLAKNATAEALGISGKQFWAIRKYSCGKYAREDLLYIYKFLTDIDLKIKTGKLDTAIMVDYIISKFIIFM